LRKRTKNDNHFAESIAQSPTERSPEQKKRGCRGCFGRFALITLIVSIPCVLALNGPGFRAVAKWGIGVGLSRLGLVAEFNLDGSLVSGLQITDLTTSVIAADATPGADSETGIEPVKESPLRSLSAAEFGISYDFRTLLSGDPIAALESITLRDADILIDLPPATDTEDVEDTPADDAKKSDPLAIVWKLLGCDFDLDNIKVRVTQGDAEKFLIEGFRLNLPAGDTGELGFTHLKVGEKLDRTATYAPLRSTGDSLILGRFELLENFAIDQLTLHQNGNDLLTAVVDADGAKLSARYRRDRSIAAELRDGPFDIGAIAEQFGAGSSLKNGTITALDVNFSGDFGSPGTWKASAGFQAADLEFPGEGIDAATLTVTADAGNLTANLSAQRKGADVDLQLQADIGSAAAPGSLADVALDLTLAADIAALEKFLPSGKVPLTGAAQLTATAQIVSREIRDGEAQLNSESLIYDGVAVKSLVLNLDVPDTNKLAARLQLALDDATQLSASGDLTLGSLDYSAELESNLVANPGLTELLGKFGFDKPLSGRIDLSAESHGSLKSTNTSDPVHNITAQLSSESLSYDGVPFESVAIDIDNPQANQLHTLVDISLDAATRISAQATLGLDQFEYQAKATIEATANDRLTDLLAKFNFTKPLQAHVKVDWSGEGIAKPADNAEPAHSGQAKVNAEGFSIDGSRKIDEAQISASYSPAGIDVEALEVTSGDLSIKTLGTYQDARIDLPSLQIRQGEKQLASGSLHLPYDRALIAEKGIIGFFEQEGPVKVDFQSTELRLEELIALSGKDSPVQATLEAQIAIDGTPGMLDGGGEIAVTGLKVTAAEEVPPGDFNLDFAIAGERLALNGGFEHPQVEPLVISGSVPFTPTKWIEGQSTPLDEPIQAEINLPASSLDFLRTYVDGIEALDGTAAIDITVAGTVREPQVSGDLTLEVADFKMQKASIPSLRDTSIKLHGEGRTLEIEKFDALVSGGQLTLAGKASLPPEGGAPLLDIQLTAREALIARNPDMNIRADADLTLNGPWTSAKLAGEIALVNSRFAKNVDILPLSMPGRERSDLPEIEKRPSFKVPPNLDIGLDITPFKDWQIDVKLITRDPFQVRGNLATIDAISDLQITGTGAKPIPNGRIYISEGRLTLPFSRVDVQKGEVAFNEATGFNGKLSLQATANVRQYDLSIYLHGRLLSPENVLTSDPPLANEDIISLLATGATRDELTGGSGSVVASKAALLFLKKLRQDGIDPDDEESFLDQLNQRTTFDIGQTDARTGEQTVAGRIRLFRQLYLVANVSAQGDYRGLLKYIFKLR